MYILLLFGAFLLQETEEFNAKETTYYFWFENKLHDSWVLQKMEESHFISCVKECKSNPDCSGIALENPENAENVTRTCHLMGIVDEEVCLQEECEQENLQLFLLDKPPTTTTLQPTTEQPTLQEITTTEETTEDDCKQPKGSAKCPEYKSRVFYGMEGPNPLFSDINLSPMCKIYSEDVFGDTNIKVTPEPFKGPIVCEDNTLITAIEICIEYTGFKYLVIQCTKLTDAFSLNDITTVRSSPFNMKTLACSSDDRGIKSVELIPEGLNIVVEIECQRIVKI